MSDHHGGATSQSSLEKQQKVALKSLIMSNLILSNNLQKTCGVFPALPFFHLL